jgi:hypothetical protein
MNSRSRTLRWSTLMLAATLLAAACGGDTSEDGANGSTESGSAQDDAGEISSGGVEDTDTADEVETDTASTSGEIDCDGIDTALDSAGALVSGDPTLFDGSPEQQFQEARVSLLTLKEQAPAIAADVDQMLAGLEAISAAFEEIGWDTDFQADPAAAVSFAQLAFSDPAVSQMITSGGNIGAWLASNCGS